MSVRAYLGIDEEAVEDAESLRQRVVVGRDWPREKQECCVTVATSEVTEYLVVCSVFLDDVDHVLDWRISPRRTRFVPSVRLCNSVSEAIELGWSCVDSSNHRERAGNFAPRC